MNVWDKIGWLEGRLSVKGLTGAHRLSYHLRRADTLGREMRTMLKGLCILNWHRWRITGSHQPPTQLIHCSGYDSGVP